MMPKKRVAVLTLGCKVNQYDSAVLEDRLTKAGFITVSGTEKSADAYIINTCTVTSRSDFQARQLARRCKKNAPDAKVMMVGCYAHAYPESCASEKAVDLVVGNQDRSAIPDLLAGLLAYDEPQAKIQGIEAIEADFGEDIPDFHRARPYLKVQDGCDSRCAYCAVPRARGPGHSLPVEEVSSRARKLLDSGYSELVLTGVHLGSYGRDLDPEASLAQLLKRLDSEVPHGARIRLSSIEPQEIDHELLAVLETSGSICHHLHIPLQSGDDRVLNLAKRPYSAMDVARIIETVRCFWPDSSIGLDLITGLPGENEEAFENTVELVESMDVTYLHVFPFSPRPGTNAFEDRHRPPQREATDRAKVLRALGAEKKKAFWRAAVESGNTFEVLVEQQDEHGCFSGTSGNYIPFSFAANDCIIGTIVEVRAEAVHERGLLGTLLNPCCTRSTVHPSKSFKRS